MLWWVKKDDLYYKAKEAHLLTIIKSVYNEEECQIKSTKSWLKPAYFDKFCN